MNESVNNLFNFYREIGKSDSAIIKENQDHSIITAEEGRWPQMIFNIDFFRNSNSQPEEVLARIMKESKQNFAVCDISNLKSENQSFLRSSGIYPIKTWTLMEVSPNENTFIQTQQNVEFRELKKGDELYEFCNLTNSELMGSLKISPVLIHELAANKKMKFYGLYFRSELASIILTYTEKEISGLYFIATKSEYRGKKLSENLIKRVINLLFSQKTEKVVLQAVQKAVPLYTRLGFKPCGNLTIFWKQ